MIPRLIHQLWTGGPLPEQLAVWRETWLRLNPGWEYVMWGDENPPVLANHDLWDRASEIVSRGVGQFRADVARYELLLEHGGVWVDLDMEALLPLDGLFAGWPLDDVGAFAAWESDGRWVNNAVMGAAPGHPLLADLVAGLRGRVQALSATGARPNVVTGPHWVTDRVERHRSDVVVLPRRTFYPYDWSQVGTPAERGPWGHETFAVHHWWNTRTNRRRPRPVGLRQARRIPR